MASQCSLPATTACRKVKEQVSRWASDEQLLPARWASEVGRVCEAASKQDGGRLAIGSKQMRRVGKWRGRLGDKAVAGG